jgi:hypothetical protein
MFVSTDMHVFTEIDKLEAKILSNTILFLGKYVNPRSIHVAQEIIVAHVAKN